MSGWFYRNQSAKLGHDRRPPEVSEVDLYAIPSMVKSGPELCFPRRPLSATSIHPRSCKDKKGKNNTGAIGKSFNAMGPVGAVKFHGEAARYRDQAARLRDELR